MLLRIAISTGAIAAAFAASALPAFAHDDCRGPVAATGRDHGSRRAAVLSAEGAWQASAADLMGIRYANWNYSGEREVACSWADDGSWYRCTARARPCARIYR